jgi:hypothetical protein
MIIIIFIFIKKAMRVEAENRLSKKKKKMNFAFWVVKKK